MAPRPRTRKPTRLHPLPRLPRRHDGRLFHPPPRREKLHAPQLRNDHPEGHATDIFTDWSINYLTERAKTPETPFFLYLAYNAPHFPIQPPEDWLEKIKKRNPGLSEKRAKNVAFVEHLDHHLGRVLQTLKETGQDKNTLVIFTSDNGGHLDSAQNNDPWRGEKQSHYDGGLKVPFIATFPGKIKPGTTSNARGLIFDTFPTILQLAGAPVPKNLDARTLLPVLTGTDPLQDRPLYFVRREGNDRYWGKDYHALVNHPWKLLQNDPFSPFELYNLDSDPGETTNLAESNPAQLKKLLPTLIRQIQEGGQTPWQKP